jgi:hypothetical protein
LSIVAQFIEDVRTETSLTYLHLNRWCDSGAQQVPKMEGKMTEHQTRVDISTVAVSANGEAIAAGDGAGYIYWLAQPGSLPWEERLADKVWAAILSADGKRLLVGPGKKKLICAPMIRPGGYCGDVMSAIA